MKEETAKQAAELLRELDMLQDIKNATIKAIGGALLPPTVKHGMIVG